MVNYAVIRISGKQFKVSEGDEVLVPLGFKKDGDFEVLLLVKDGKVSIGKPLVKGAKVITKLLEEKVKAKKITIQKYKAKSRYRRKLGFRHLSSKILIESIS